MASLLTSKPSNFNSRTSCEVRRTCRSAPDEYIDFNSRTSCEVRRVILGISTAQYSISTHAPRVRCDILHRAQLRIAHISTHAPRVRCDLFFGGIEHECTDFNSRTSCEVRLVLCSRRGIPSDFNSRTSCEVRHQG